MKFRGIPNTKKQLRVELLESRDLLSVVASNGGLDSEPPIISTDGSCHLATDLTAPPIYQSAISIEGDSTSQYTSSDISDGSICVDQSSLSSENSERLYSVLAKDVFYRLEKYADARGVVMASIVSEWLNSPAETFAGEDMTSASNLPNDSTITSLPGLTYRLRGSAPINNQYDTFGTETLASAMTLSSDEESPLEDSIGGGSSSGGDNSFLYADISRGCVNIFSGGGLSFPTDHVVAEGGTFILLTATTVDATVTVSISGVDSSDFLVNEACGALTFSILSDAYYEGDEVMTITVTAVSSEGTAQRVITVTIVDSPEFISILDIKQNVAANAVTNDRSEFFFDTSMLYRVTDIYDINVLHAHDINLQWAPGSVPDWSVTGNNIALDVANEKIIYIPDDDYSTCYGEYVGGMVASYKDAENFSDTLNLSIKWADIEKAKTSVRNCREATFNLSYRIGTETCERFAFDLEEALNELMETDINLRLAVFSVNVVYFSVNSVNPYITGHAAVAVTYRDGTTIYYDNARLIWGVWEYTSEQFPENVHLENGD